MIKYLYDNYIIMYTFAALCGLGLLLRAIVNMVYKHLVKESKRIGETKNKMLLYMKKKFTACYKAKIGVNNVDTFVDKNILSYRFCGILLSTWDNICGQVLYMILLIVPIIAVLGVMEECGQSQLLLNGVVGIASGAVLILVDKSINLSNKKKLLRVNLLDYLENFCKVRLEQEAVNPDLMEQYRVEYYQAAKGRKKNKIAAATEAKKDEPKDELSRRRLARIKKEEEKKLLTAKREEEQRRLQEQRQEEENRKQEERKQRAAKRREEERLKLEEERLALESRIAEMKSKSEDRQLTNAQKQKNAIEQQSLLRNMEEDLKSTQSRTDMKALMKGVEEIAAGREVHSSGYHQNKTTESERERSRKAPVKPMILDQEEEKLIEDVLKDFFA